VPVVGRSRCEGCAAKHRQRMRGGAVERRLKWRCAACGYSFEFKPSICPRCAGEIEEVKRAS
jgi:rubrerythrin